MFKLRLSVLLAVVFIVAISAGVAQAQGPSATLLISAHPQLGSILTDGEGKTLYLFTRDERELSNCAGNCAGAWPPLLTGGAPVAGEGVAANRLTTIARADGGTQVAYNGWPLYYFAQDLQPGDANGQAVNNVWWAVSRFGGPIQNNVLVNVAEHPELGTILADRSGRTQYLFTNDDRNASNCAGNCALAWPPLLTVGAPTAGEGVNAGRLGTIERADGGAQVTYNGWPLYYFARDNRPGDVSGQSVANWWVVSEFGGPVETNATVEIAQHAELGSILADASTGRTLYVFVPDFNRSATCVGNCALVWPPLLTSGAPAAGDGAQSNLLRTTTHPDGGTQVMYNGWPVYFYTQDNTAGDANGQSVGDRWFVLTAQGQPVPGPNQSIPPGGPRLPGVGDAIIAALAQIGLPASLALIAAGGLILYLRRRKLSAR